VNIGNCIIYGPAESYSLWTEVGANGQSLQIINLYSWVGGFSVVDTYHGDSATYQRGAPRSGAPWEAPPRFPQHAPASIRRGLAFIMNYTVYAYRYYSRGGGGKGGGGAGTRWWVTGGSVTITQ
jgi:hypothetical protein